MWAADSEPNGISKHQFCYSRLLELFPSSRVPVKGQLELWGFFSFYSKNVLFKVLFNTLLASTIFVGLETPDFNVLAGGLLKEEAF